MDKFVILLDSTCDLTKELRDKYGVEYIFGHLKTPDGKEQVCPLDWETITASEFYKSLRAAPNDFSTSPPNIDEWKNAFEKYTAEGYGVLVMTISSSLSGTYNFATQAAKETLETNEKARIRIIDSRRFSSACGLMATYASDMRASGKTLDETADWIEENKNRFHQAGWLDDLSFVAKKGRLTKAKAFFGTLVGVKPIGEFDYNGLTTVIGKAKGEKQAYKVLLDYVEKTIENPEDQIIIIATSDRQKQAEAYKAMIEERFKPKAVYVNSVYPASGVNVGPGLMAAYYLGKPISEGLTEEKSIIEELLK